MPHGGGFGVSFVPGQGEQNTQNGPGRPGGANPVQSAIQMLSLRLPRLGGAQGLAPGPLLQAPGGGGMPGGGLGGGVADNPLLQALLRLAGIFGGQGGGMGAPALPMGGGMGAPPIPRVIPGSDPSMAPRPGPGVPTFPPTGGGPTIDRRPSQPGNRDGGPILNTSGTNLPPGAPPDRGRGDWWSGPVDRRPFNRSF